MQWPSPAPRPRLRRAQGSLESSCRGEYSALNMARPTQRAGAFRTRPPSHKRLNGACKDKANLSRPPVGLSGPGHRKPLTTDQRPDMSATSSIRVPHLRRPASSRLHALFPAKCCTSETRRHRSSGYGVALSILACSAALTSCAETFQECHAALFPQDLPALVSRSNRACLHTCFGGSACSPCLVACVACSACLPPNAHFLF